VLLCAEADKAPGFLSGISPNLTGPAPRPAGQAAPTYSGPAFWLYVVGNFPALLGMAILPFTMALWIARPRVRTATSYWWILPAIVALLALALAGFVAFSSTGRSIFVGDEVNNGALGEPFLLGNKVSPFPGPTFLVLVVLSMTSYLVFLLIRRDPWALSRLGASGQILVLVAALQMASSSSTASCSIGTTCR
jgi:hypothetical protein